jgi:hypothetical protein
VTALLIDPHGDDAILFASYTCLRQKPFVVVMYPTVPEDEIGEAFEELGCEWTYWENRPANGVTHVYAPAHDLVGHHDHNNAAADASLWRVPVTYYTTYAPRGQRTRTDNEVPYEPWMVERKLRALSCFVSQIEQESTRPWFTYLLDVREWLSD